MQDGRARHLNAGWEGKASECRMGGQGLLLFVQIFMSENSWWTVQCAYSCLSIWRFVLFTLQSLPHTSSSPGFGNMTYANFYAEYGGECLQGFKMVASISCTVRYTDWSSHMSHAYLIHTSHMSHVHFTWVMHISHESWAPHMSHAHLISMRVLSACTVMFLHVCKCMASQVCPFIHTQIRTSMYTCAHTSTVHVQY